ncbi:hypothetical protein PRIPAC_80226, partial [Pristionchus pacificus]|uniref:Uncharacterized protein n=1 Tax=Pristionchus pacificus TaxID=54126 RepID=A0A2A6CJV4_PRIPA
KNIIALTGNSLEFLQNQELKDRLQMRVECSDRCACNANHCTNRAVQKGRQAAVIIFRDLSKGWCLRAASEYSTGDYIGEYIGK